MGKIHKLIRITISDMLLFLMSLTILDLSPAADPRMEVLGPTYNDEKISTIMGIIVLCDAAPESNEYCDDLFLNKFTNDYPKLKFLSRNHLDLMLKEQSLKLSGLTEVEKSKTIGKILGASHIVLYHVKRHVSKMANHEFFSFKLINIVTSEVEFNTHAEIIEYHKGEHIEDWKHSIDTLFGQDFYTFLNILNKHAFNTDGRRVFVKDGGVKYYLYGKEWMKKGSQ